MYETLLIAAYILLATVWVVSTAIVVVHSRRQQREQTR